MPDVRSILLAAMRAGLDPDGPPSLPAAEPPTWLQSRARAEAERARLLELERLALEAQLVAADAVALAAAEVRRRARSALAPIPGRWAAATGRTAEDAAVLAELLAEALEPLEAQADAALGGGPPGAGT